MHDKLQSSLVMLTPNACMFTTQKVQPHKVFVVKTKALSWLVQAARQATAAALKRSRAVELLLMQMENKFVDFKVNQATETLHRHSFRRGDGRWGWSMAWVNEDPEAAYLVSF